MEEGEETTPAKGDGLTEDFCLHNDMKAVDTQWKLHLGCEFGFLSRPQQSACDLDAGLPLVVTPQGGGQNGQSTACCCHAGSHPGASSGMIEDSGLQCWKVGSPRPGDSIC